MAVMLVLGGKKRKGFFFAHHVQCTLEGVALEVTCDLLSASGDRSIIYATQE